MSEQHNKAKIREAQARHQSQLFGGAAQKPSSQVAGVQAKQRGDHLTQAARTKEQRLSQEEEARLAALRKRNEQARRQQPQPQAPPQAHPQQSRRPAPPRKAGATAELRQVAERSDVAAAALENMQRHVRQQAARSATPAKPTPPPVPTPAPTPPPPTQSPPSGQPAAEPSRAPTHPARPSRRPPSPEELDKLLRQMAQRSRQRPPAGAAPGGLPRRPAVPGGLPERSAESAAPFEAEPPPPELIEKERESAEQSAEILKELKAREVQVRQDIAPIPQADQTRAREEAVQANVPIRTQANAIQSGPLHDAIVELQQAMRVGDPTGTVTGANQVQRQMPHHPLYEPDAGKERGS